MLLLGIAYVVPGLVGHDPWKPNEAYSFGIIYTVWGGGDWVVPILAGEPFMEKPPLFYIDRKSTRLNSSHQIISYAVFCLKKKKNITRANCCQEDATSAS